MAAIFGPESGEINEIIQSTSLALQIPHFQTFWNPKLVSFSEQLPPDKSIPVFNLYPSPRTLAQGIGTLVRESNWNTYTIIYENDEGLVRLQETLNQRLSGDPVITYRKLGPGPDHRLDLYLLIYY